MRASFWYAPLFINHLLDDSTTELVLGTRQYQFARRLRPHRLLVRTFNALSNTTTRELLEHKAVLLF